MGRYVRETLLIVVSLPATLLGQPEAKPDAWETFRYFVGSWDKTETGRPGVGTGQREYQFILQGKFLHARNRSVFEPQEKNPKGEVHEDWAFVSFDRNRKKFVLREFHVEGFVNQHVLEELAPDGKAMTFVTESIENIASGWRARLTIKVLNDNEFKETFELAAPGKDFQVYIENHLRRRRGVTGL